MFLAALAPELAVISSSGYPSEFSYLFEKERKHCACNLLPGVAYGPEMWEIYSVFAPKPMLLEHGKWDHLLPYDLGKRNARKIENTYIQMGAQEQFKDEFGALVYKFEAATSAQEQLEIVNAQYHRLSPEAHNVENHPLR